MHVARHRTHVLVSLFALVVLTLGCGSEPTPPPPSSKPAPAPEATPEAPPEPVPEAKENCDIEVLGGREVERAALDTNNGKLTKIEVINGRTLKIVCPEGDERQGALIIAELKAQDGVHSVNNIVSWKVDLDPDPSTTKLRLVDSSPGVPELNEEDLALLKEEAMPGMVEWAVPGDTETGGEEMGEDAAEPGDPSAPGDAPVPTKKAVVKVSVEFNAGRLKWAELSYENVKTKRAKKVVLDNKVTKMLEPGVYALSVRYPENSQEWKDAGTIEIAEGLKSAVVTMKESPTLRGDIVSSQ